MTNHHPTITAAVPVFRVASVATSMAWYRDVLGFSGESVGPPADPVFAILSHGGVEIMLQKARPGVGPPRAAGGGEGGWDVYLRVGDVAAFRESARSKASGVGAIHTREYGCLECVLTDPDGHTIVLGECA